MVEEWKCQFMILLLVMLSHLILVIRYVILSVHICSMFSAFHVKCNLDKFFFSHLFFSFSFSFVIRFLPMVF